MGRGKCLGQIALIILITYFCQVTQFGLSGLSLQRGLIEYERPPYGMPKGDNRPPVDKAQRMASTYAPVAVLQRTIGKTGRGEALRSFKWLIVSNLRFKAILLKLLKGRLVKIEILQLIWVNAFEKA